MVKNRIKSILHQRGMNQNDLAKELGVQPETLSRTINGNPTLKSLSEIAKVLKVDVGDLFSPSGPHGYVEYGDKLYKIKSVEDLKALMLTIDNEII